MTGHPTLLFVVTEDWYFWTHRRHLAEASIAAGWRVALAANVARHEDAIRDLGVEVFPLAWDRGSTNPIGEWRVIRQLRDVVTRVRPDIVHNVAMKPVLHSQWLPRGPRMVNAVSGVGYVFLAAGGRARLLQTGVRLGLRRALRQPRGHTVVQNRDDEALVNALGSAPERTSIIEGVGINTEHYRVAEEPDGPVRFAIVTRMLWDKGIAELVDAARMLRAEGLDCVVEFVGEPDAANRASVTHSDLQSWANEGVIEYSGWCEDVREVWRRAHVAVLPSYREGMPKALLEAAGCGRPMIATDVPGCRAIVSHEKTGLLVPKGESAPLAQAMRTLAEDAALRARMGAAARQSAEQRFSAARVTAQFESLYLSLLG